MKKYFKSFLLFAILVNGLFLSFNVFAEGEVIGDDIPNTQNEDLITPEEEIPDEEVVLPEPILVYREVDIPKTCDVLDTDGVPHTYTASSSESYLGICALDALLKEGGISSVGLSNQYPDMGLFVVSFNGVTADPSSQYWALYQNGNYAVSGLSTLPIVVNDIISFRLSDFSGSETGDSVDIKVRALILDTVQGDDGDSEGNENSDNGSSGGSSSGGSQTGNNFSKEEAIAFMLSNQLDDNSFGEDMYTDWVAIGLAKIDLNDDSLLKTIKNYLKSDQVDSSSVTESERRAMALMALGVDPKNGTDEDYIEEITSFFDGEQIGNVDFVNDDIFALIVLSHAGFDKDNEMIKKIISFIISNQEDNGSWGSVDMTAAAIQSLINFKKVEGVSSAISLGEKYLVGMQEIDGGFGNVYSTSWAVQALLPDDSFSEKLENAIENLKDYQEEDGSMGSGDIKDKVWSTAYALPAIYKLSWDDILDSFYYENEEEKDNGTSSGGSSVSEFTQNKEDIEDVVEPVSQDDQIIPELKTNVVSDVKTTLNNVNKTRGVHTEENKINQNEIKENLLPASVANIPVPETINLSLILDIKNFIKEVFVRLLAWFNF